MVHPPGEVMGGLFAMEGLSSATNKNSMAKLLIQSSIYVTLRTNNNERILIVKKNDE